MPIREARLADARRIAEINIACWKTAYRSLLPDRLLDALTVEDSASRWQVRLSEGADQTLVFEEAGLITGFTQFGASRDDDTHATATGEIHLIYIDPQQWGKGQGRALSEEAMETLRAEGFSEVTLWVLHNNERAQRFYTAMGFAADGATKVKTRRDGTRMRVVRYRRQL